MKRISLALSMLLISVAAISAVMGAIVINEVELNPSGERVQWVELYNDGDEEVDIGGWTISIIDTPWIGPMEVPNGTMILAGGFYVAEGQLQWAQHNNGTVILEDEAGSEVDRTHLLTDSSNTDFTYSRFPNGVDTGQSKDWAFMKSTRNGENSMSGAS